MQGVTGSIPVVSTTQKDHPTGWSFLRGGDFCVGIDRNVRRSICGTDGPAYAPCIAVGAGILYAAPQERRIHSRLRFYSFFGFRTRILTSTQIAFAI